MYVLVLGEKSLKLQIICLFVSFFLSLFVASLYSINRCSYGILKESLQNVHGL
jgi:hypothetical protein